MYYQDRSTYFLQQKAYLVGIYKSLKTHKCGNWDYGHASPVLGIFVSNFRYWFFAVGDVDAIYETDSMVLRRTTSLHTLREALWTLSLTKAALLVR
jgi:hypothetical protein